MQTVDQVFPIQRQVPLDGLYLGQRLKDLAAELGRSIVLTDYVTDKNGVVARAGKQGHLEVPAETKNDSDWGRYQELLAQADVMISSGSYFNRLAKKGAQQILYQFEPGQAFEAYGEWRLQAGYQTRSPDVAIVNRDLDFEIPEELRHSGRRILVFTTDALAQSDQARALSDANTRVLGCGRDGVEGEKLIATLAGDYGYRVIMMVSGPQILQLLLAAGRLDLLYVTEAQVQVPFDDPDEVRTLLPGGQKVDELRRFHLAHKFVQEGAVTENGSRISQFFLRYDADDLRR